MTRWLVLSYVERAVRYVERAAVGLSQKKMRIPLPMALLSEKVQNASTQSWDPVLLWNVEVDLQANNSLTPRVALDS